jgi:TolA-binding protein
MVGLALLAASATAAAAFYLVQKNSVQSVKSLLGEFESFQETHRLSRLNWEQEVRDLELEMEKLSSLVDRNEVDVHKIGQLEAGIQRLEGKFEGLSEIRPSSSTSRDGPPEANNGID